MLAGLDRILESIKENPDNAKLASRYLQLATDDFSSEGVEAVKKLVDVYVDLYPKRALEIATALLDYARHDSLDKQCEKMAMEKVAECFLAMGKIAEADKILDEIKVSFESPLQEANKQVAEASHDNETYLVQNLDDDHASVVANHSSEDLLVATTLEQSVASTVIIGDSKLDDESSSDLFFDAKENPVIQASIAPDLSTESQDINSTQKEESEVELSDSESKESKLNANVKIHLPVEQIELEEKDSARASMVAMNERGLGPNLLTESSEHRNTQFSTMISYEQHFWRDAFASIEERKIDSQLAYKTALEGQYIEANCYYDAGDLECVSELIWKHYSTLNYAMSEAFFEQLEMSKVRSFLKSQNLDMKMEELFKDFLNRLFEEKHYRKIEWYLKLYLEFDGSLRWATFIYSQYKRYWLETMEVGFSWDEKEGVERLVATLSKRAYPSASKLSV